MVSTRCPVGGKKRFFAIFLDFRSASRPGWVNPWNPQPRHKIRTLLTMFTSKKPGPRNVLPSGDLPMGKSLFFVSIQRPETSRRRPGSSVFRLFGLRFRYFECWGCPAPCFFGTFSRSDVPRSVFAQIYDFDLKARPGVFSFHLFRIQVKYLDSSNADRRTAELFQEPPWPEFFQIS